MKSLCTIPMSMAKQRTNSSRYLLQELRQCYCRLSMIYLQGQSWVELSSVAFIQYCLRALMLAVHVLIFFFLSTHKHIQTHAVRGQQPYNWQINSLLTLQLLSGLTALSAYSSADISHSFKWHVNSHFFQHNIPLTFPIPFITCISTDISASFSALRQC